MDAVVATTLGDQDPTSAKSKARSRCYWRGRRQRDRHAAKEGAKAKARAENKCPITLVDVRELAAPFLGSDGAIYEENALLEWYGRSHTSPLTRQPLLPGVPLDVIKAAVARNNLSLCPTRKQGTKR